MPGAAYPGHPELLPDPLELPLALPLEEPVGEAPEVPEPFDGPHAESNASRQGPSQTFVIVQPPSGSESSRSRLGIPHLTD